MERLHRDVIKMWRCIKCGWEGNPPGIPDDCPGAIPPEGKCPKCEKVHSLERFDPENPDFDIDGTPTITITYFPCSNTFDCRIGSHLIPDLTMGDMEKIRDKITSTLSGLN